jgi:hypothetical protein
LLHEQLREWGIDISVGQINALLSGANDEFLTESKFSVYPFSPEESAGHMD